jgi:hypothetical protein
MYAFRTAALAASLALMATTPVLAADQVVIQPKPVVLDTPPPQTATQKGMSGPGDTKPAAKAATKAKKAKKAAGKKPKKNIKKNKRSRR